MRLKAGCYQVRVETFRYINCRGNICVNQKCRQNMLLLLSSILAVEVVNILVVEVANCKIQVSAREFLVSNLDYLVCDSSKLLL